jgi:ElaB/YqjD/DUF883 family membrane-anchored ribosome-binding protein
MNMEEYNRPTSEQGSPTARDVMNKGSKTFDEAKEAMRQAYERSARSIGHTYDQALEYSRHNPGKTALIAFGIGVGVGMLLLGSARRSRVSRYGEPIVNALSNMALEFIRTL